MTDREAAIVLARLVGAYPALRLQAETTELWLGAIHRVGDVGTAERIAETLVMSCDRFPSLAEWGSLARRAQSPERQEFPALASAEGPASETSAAAEIAKARAVLQKLGAKSPPVRRKY
jgi:hypothetical protein